VQLWGAGAYEREAIDGSQTRYSRLFRAEVGDIIVNKIWARNGSVAVIRGPLAGCYGSAEFPMFAPSPDRLEPLWIHWLTKTHGFWEQCDEKSRGTSGKNRIRPERFLEIEIPLPPLAEQQQIVARIEELAALIDEARALRQPAESEAQALVRSSLRRLSESIAVDGHLGDVLAESPRNGWSPVCDNAIDGTPVLSLGAVTGFRYRSTEFKRSSLPATPRGHFWLRPGDLLITRSNTPELVGHAAIYDGSPTPCIYPDLMMRLLVRTDRADPRFAWYWLQSPAARAFVAGNAKGTSPTMKKISQATVTAIPYPSSLQLATQCHIVAELDALRAEVDAVKRLQAETATELDALLPSILDRAFGGGL
jgi:type I restriction enzyme S subunit